MLTNKSGIAIGVMLSCRHKGTMWRMVADPVADYVTRTKGGWL